ncbi:hypothetical protein HPB51_002598 [Rhipicephalus microplus]|uniref:Uncharacterized protein n=1 Tax=Rhipicephalus microplus TaxID=6941 RepID=A0A9J6DFD2_RHIMP|nr:hypothetical protein HPB51_002598 [Rhipicephalus microplus]
MDATQRDIWRQFIAESNTCVAGMRLALPAHTDDHPCFQQSPSLATLAHCDFPKVAHRRPTAYRRPLPVDNLGFPTDNLRIAVHEFRTSSGVSRNVRKIVSHPVTEGSDGNSDGEKKAARDYAEKKWVQINISYRLLPLTAVQ